MKFTLFIILLITVIIHIVVSALAIMQAKRFRYINKRTRVITWGYIIVSTALAVGILATFFAIEF